jgi:hypothetical protein
VANDTIAIVTERDPESPGPERDADRDAPDQLEPFWQEADITSDEDVRRDTVGPDRQRELRRAFQDD